jgi:hypothetical protein
MRKLLFALQALRAVREAGSDIVSFVFADEARARAQGFDCSNANGDARIIALLQSGTHTSQKALAAKLKVHSHKNPVSAWLEIVFGAKGVKTLRPLNWRQRSRRGSRQRASGVLSSSSSTSASLSSSPSSGVGVQGAVA